jgi:hypothetical protein
MDVLRRRVRHGALPREVRIGSPLSVKNVKNLDA